MGVAWWNLQSQLLVAIQKDDVMRAKELLADGVDCDARFLFGSHRRPALCLCVERDSLDLVRLLLDWGCSVNQSDTRGQTALHLAASRGQFGLLEHLLRSKASVRALDEQKRTPLHWAAQHTSPEMALLLLQHQAAVDPLDQDGRTPLLLACQNPSSSITAQQLLRHGANARAVDLLGNTALHLATDPPLIRALIASGAAVDACNHAGLTPLHLAVRHTSSRNEIVSLLAEAGCQVDQPTPLGQTALHTVVQERDESSAILLLRYHARPDTVDRLGLPPLFHAARDGNLRLVQALLAAGAYQTLRDPHSWMRQPHLLAEIRDKKILQLLQTSANACPRLTWLARSAFREHAKEKSCFLASQLLFPPSLIQFIDFSDVFEDWI
ncbi:ankyrin repeat and protein kinase domain-containing protein 1-like [Daphnia carinata]|uniref:ankyrin repeat and protein kinase domain-containing protein 1-like n=1 Tax=Daphnia carinata TaxID=120202 RepID=UPI002580A461|nr:ankyrin repeat and protein kinase domain-containing protein 1-like [Daphnia carinata]XP_057380490.1 ankyrin repeat and protein kinase domain-containing protein 1-like [Daphnia carinata]